MISKNLIKLWKNDEKSIINLSSIIVGFDGINKTHILSNGYFDIFNRIDNKIVCSKILSEILKKYIGNKFFACLENPNYSWNPKTFKNVSFLNEVNDYFEKNNFIKKNEELYGELEIHDLFSFLSVFLDYPQKLSYQDIELFSIVSDLAFNISNHGTFWIITDDNDIKRNIYNSLNKTNLVVLQQS